MDFKDRFKGRSSTIGKVGVIETLASAANPVVKSQSNSQFTSYNKAMVSIPEDLPRTNMNNRNISHHSVDSRPPVPLQAANNYSRSPGGYSGTNQNYQPRLPTGSTNQSAVNNPYMVSNPMPTLDVMDNQHYRSYENSPDVRNRSDYGMQQQQQQYYQQNNPQNVAVSQFNPNSFYNQHSQFKNGLSGQTPKKENIDVSNSYVPSSNGQQYKKNFENPSQPTKQKRAAEEVLRGFENHTSPQRVLNGRYEGYEQAAQNQRPPQSMPGYSGYRDIHSNPLPQQYQDVGGYNYNPQNATYQNDRRQQPYEDFNQQNNMNNQDHPKHSGQSKTAYKPYNIKDYKDMKMRTPVNLGGLGPNTNTGEWYKEREKRDKMAEFSQNVKLFNAQRVPVTDIGFKPRKDKDKDRSRREIALDFAKNIPKPKPRKQSPGFDEEEDHQYKSPKRPESETRVNHRSGMGGGDLDELEERHNQYVAQLQRMKNN